MYGLGRLGAEVQCHDADGTNTIREGSCDGSLIRIIPEGHDFPPPGAPSVQCTDADGTVTIRQQDCGGPLLKILQESPPDGGGSPDGGGGGPAPAAHPAATQAVSAAQLPSLGTIAGIPVSYILLGALAVWLLK